MGGHNEDAMEWPEDREKYFLEILAERVKKDPNGAPIFKVTDWTEMDEQIFMKYAIRYGIEKLKAKFQRLKSMHTKFSELINNTGVTWDFVSGQVFANETVWDDLSKRDKIFKRFKKKGCKIYALLSLVFSNSTASGAFHNASTCAPQTSQEEHRIEDEYLDSGNVSQSEVNGGTKKCKRKLEEEIEGVPGMRRMKKTSGSSKYDTLMDVWSQSMLARKERDLAKAEQYKSKSSDATTTLVEEYSIGDCMSTLEAIPDVFLKYYVAIQSSVMNQLE